ncbi:MAG: tetratricopeptide repeat protein [Verrucomicrobiales bacterium]|nr:tetratricopeptide repeat protein [Verrucomicrobiales bacterium]
MLIRLFCLAFLCCSFALHAAPPVRGSIIEDRAARKLNEAGELRYDAGEQEKAIELWRSVIERYPRSKARFQAHLKLGEHHLTKGNAYEKARTHFEAVASEDNKDGQQRAEATLKMGICFFEGRHYGQCFKVMRKVIEEFPVAEQVNQAYYYIGLGHFKQGHYGRAIAALEKVGTAVGDKDQNAEKLEAGKRFFVKIEDADLAILKKDEAVSVKVRTSEGDEEKVKCVPIGRNVRVVLGSIPTRLGKPRPGNGILEVTGTAKVQVDYIDAHTAARAFDVDRKKQVTVVGNALVQVMDGAFAETLRGVVLGKEANVQVSDADRDVSDAADNLKIKVEVLRSKTPLEIEDEKAKLIAEGALGPTTPGEKPLPVLPDSEPIEAKLEVDPFKVIDTVELTLTEALRKVEEKLIEESANPPADGNSPATAPEPKDEDLVKEIEQQQNDGSIHTGLFRGTVPVESAEVVVAGDPRLQAQPGDLIRLSYTDTLNIGAGPRDLATAAKCVEGNLGGVRVTRTEISDAELELQTKLKTASALTQIGTQYRDFGLDEKAKLKYEEALGVCEEVVTQARKIGGGLLEETYMQLWRIYFSMDRLNLAAAMSLRLQREFPESIYLDEAILQQARVAQKSGDFARAIALYTNLTRLTKSQLRGEGQYGIGECYEAMARAARGNAEQMYERAFQAYKTVFDHFPESGRVGDAVAKMASFYYQKKDYARAVDVFEKVLSDHPDANFLDVILFNYGRCLFRMNRKAEASKRFNQLIDEFPGSSLAPEAKRISQALTKSGN